MSKAEVTFPASGGGGGLQYWIESEDATTQQSTQWIPSNSATNVNAVVSPKGNGANTAQIPDGTSTGGNSRGHYATDWQKQRNSANEVASGNSSTIGGGRNNRASGADATIGGGHTNTSTSNNSTIAGGADNTSSNNDNVVGGGRNNIASGQYATISGGINNTADNYLSNVTGGSNNNATNDNTRAGGFKARADQANLDAFAWEAAEFAQHIKKGGYYDLGFISNSGGSFVVSEIVLNGTNSAMNLNLKVILRNTGGYLGSAGSVECFECNVVVKRTAGVTSIVGSPIVNYQVGDWATTGTTLSFGILGATLQATAIIPSGAGDTDRVRAYFVFEGLEMRI